MLDSKVSAFRRHLQCAALYVFVEQLAFGDSTYNVKYTYVEIDIEEDASHSICRVDLSVTRLMLLWVSSTIPRSQGKSWRVGPVKRGLSI